MKVLLYEWFYQVEVYVHAEQDYSSDWFSSSKEVVNTIGGEVNIALIPDRLDFDLSYSYTDVDGKIDFFTTAVATAEFPIVDDTKFHILDVGVIVHFIPFI